MVSVSLPKRLRISPRKIDSRPIGVNYSKNNDVIMSYNPSYIVFPNIAPYSGNRIDTPQFVETVRNLFKTSNYDDEQRTSSYQFIWDPNIIGMDLISSTVMITHLSLKKFDLFEETFVTKLSLKEYTNFWMNLKLT